MLLRKSGAEDRAEIVRLSSCHVPWHIHRRTSRGRCSIRRRKTRPTGSFYASAGSPLALAVFTLRYNPRSFAAENTNPAATCLDNEERFYSKGMENVRQSLENRLRSRFGKDSVVKSLDVLEKSQAYNSDFLTVEASFVLDVPRSPDERGTLTAKMTKECNVISLNLEY